MHLAQRLLVDGNPSGLEQGQRQNKKVSLEENVLLTSDAFLLHLEISLALKELENKNSTEERELDLAPSSSVFPQLGRCRNGTRLPTLCRMSQTVSQMLMESLAHGFGGPPFAGEGSQTLGKKLHR